jgi:hypothetical protein
MPHHNSSCHVYASIHISEYRRTVQTHREVGHRAAKDEVWGGRIQFWLREADYEVFNQYFVSLLFKLVQIPYILVLASAWGVTHVRPFLAEKPHFRPGGELCVGARWHLHKKSYLEMSFQGSLGP